MGGQERAGLDAVPERVAVVEDTAATRIGLVSELEAAGYAVTATDSAGALFAHLAVARPDVAIIDLYLEGSAGPPAFEVVSTLVEDAIPVIVYSTWALDPDVLTALDRGASAFLQKTPSLSPLLDAIRRVLDQAPGSPALLTPAVAGAMQRRDRFRLTAAELEVLQLVNQHLTNAEIASIRYVSEDTVKTQVTSIRQKLGAATRGEAVRAARQHGLIGGWGPAR